MHLQSTKIDLPTNQDIDGIVNEKKVESPYHAVRLLDIALTFLNIGMASFSLSALGETKKWVTTKKGWFTDDEYLQGLGLAQLLPGAPTINLSSYLGYRLRKLAGAATATVFFLVPCFFLMILLSHLYFKYGELPLVSRLFKGLGALVIGLVFNTILNLFQSGVKSVLNWTMALLGFICVFWFKMGVIRILLIAGGLNIVMAILTSRFNSLRAVTFPVSEFFKKAGKIHDVPVESMRIDNHEPVQKASWLPTFETAFRLSLILLLDIALICLNPQVKQMGISFLRIGSLVFGSGYAMLPFIQDAVVNKYAWLTNPQFAVALALSLVTPGPVTIIGAFIGYKVFGVLGALAGMINMYFPAWAMTTLIAAPYARAGRIAPVKQIIGGIVAAFIGTLVVVLIRLSVSTLLDIPTISMAAAAFFIQRYSKINTVWIVLSGAVVSMAIF